MPWQPTFKPGDFDYQRAWRKWAAPEFQCLPADVRTLYEDIRDHHGDLRQDHDLDVSWPDEELRTRFDNVPAEILSKAVVVVYDYGHWGSGWAIPNDGGAYWKFEKLAKKSLIARGPEACKWGDHEPDTKPFIVPHPHEVAIDEALKDSGLVRHDVIHCNWDPHPFVIGPKHLENSKGMFLEPDSAPCAHPGCRLRYAHHRSDRVLVLKGLRLEDDRPVVEQEVAIRFLASVLEEHGIDGITFLKE